MPILPIKELRPGMILAEYLLDPHGTFLIAPGQVITQEWINRLGRWHVKAVSIKDASDAQIPAPPSYSRTPSLPSPSQFAFQAFCQEQRRIEDAIRENFLATAASGVLDTITLQGLVRDHLYPLLNQPKLPIFLHMPGKQEDYLYRHAFDCAMFAGLLARWLEYSTPAVAQLMFQALIMDIGKLFVADNVINKPATLTIDERQQAKAHLEYGYRLLLDSKQVNSATLEAIYQHHERLDGSGYPRGLRGAAILQSSRVLSIVDVYDAMVSHRCYRQSLTPLQAAEAMIGSMDSQLDLSIMHCFTEEIRRFFLGETVLLSDGNRATIAAFPALPLLRPLVLLPSGAVLPLAHDTGIDIIRWETTYWDPPILPFMPLKEEG